MLETSYLIPLIPLVAFIVILAFGRYLPLQGAWIGVLSMLWCLIHSVVIFIGIYNGHLSIGEGWLHGEWFAGEFFERTWQWFQIGPIRMEMGILIDGVSSVMLVVVCLVSFLVQLYSLEYQTDTDERHQKQLKPYFGRYFAYVSFFTASMLLLVVANNFLQFFIGWELVGLCSYLLIGFEFERPAAAYAGRKAFITTKVGDLGFYIGLFLLFSVTGTFNFVLLHREYVLPGFLSPELVTVVCILLFMGAIGKSAQVPLHVWLPDAMEGPTPVSALIHAATMVAAGVYMVARVFFLYELSPVALQMVGWIGGLTAFFAATMALVTEDIKRVLAFSTVSQLGYMFMALGAGSLSSGMFHLTTHATFKALLFLGAGAVIHAVHTNDMFKMGGLSKKMPFTFFCFACGWLAISGFPYLSGFLSKDQILFALHDSGQTLLFWMGVITAALTAFYMTRLFSLTFLGDARDSHRFVHAQDPGFLMIFPLAVLAICSLFSGVLFVYQWPFEKWVHLMSSHKAEVHHGFFVPIVSIVASVLGAGLAFSMYRMKLPNPQKLAQSFSGLYRLLKNRYYIDEAYLWLIDKCLYIPAQKLSQLDFNVVDQICVDGWAWIIEKFAALNKWVDDHIIDHIFVDGWGRLSLSVGNTFRRLQTGFVQWYLFVITLGLSFLTVWVVNSVR